MKFIYLLILAISSHAYSAGILKDKIQEAITKHEKFPNTGVSMIVIHQGKVILREAFGYADPESKRAVTPSTLFAIGSTTKAFTATSLLMMQDEGRLDLSTPVKNILPEFNLSDKNVLEKINTYDLLSHHSGLPRHDLMWYYTPFAADELLSRMACLEPNPNPGMGFREGFQYNNLMFMVAGTVLEKVSGLTWTNFVQTRIFDELGMNQTLTSTTELNSSLDVAVPYDNNFRMAHLNIDQVKPAGSIYSNINDLEKWLRFLLAKGKTTSGKILLSEENFNHMTELHTRIASNDRDLGYGLAWIFDRTAGQNIIFHTGAIDGFSALIAFYPEKEIAMAILVNQHASSINWELLQTTFEELLGNRNAQPLKLASLRSWEKVANDINLDELMGNYSNCGYGNMSILKMNGRTIFKYYRLEQEIDENFLKEIEVIRVDGKIIGIAVNLEDNAPKIRFLKI